MPPPGFPTSTEPPFRRKEMTSVNALTVTAEIDVLQLILPGQSLQTNGAFSHAIFKML